MFLLNVILFIICLNVDKSKTLPTSGACQTLENCPALGSLVQTKKDDFGTRILLNALHCYIRDYESYLRCPTQSEIDDFMGKIELLPPQENCGLQSLASKIDNGETAELEDFPWLALIKYKKDNSQPRYGCTGNLINKRYILTAAHCVDRRRIRKEFGYINKIVLGEYHIYNTTDCFYDDYGKSCTDGIQEYSVESFHVHPDYSLDSHKADIALIRLDRDVKMTDFIKPICLPGGVLYLDSAEKLWIGGWGENSTFDLNAVKMKASFKKLEHSGCASAVVLNENHICATATNFAKTCSGDSGGPLMAIRRTSGSYRYYLAGVLSLGPQCSKDLRFSIYTRVSGFLGWIMEQIH